MVCHMAEVKASFQALQTCAQAVASFRVTKRLM
jgi:hypothetical protein